MLLLHNPLADLTLVSLAQGVETYLYLATPWFSVFVWKEGGEAGGRGT